MVYIYTRNTGKCSTGGITHDYVLYTRTSRAGHAQKPYSIHGGWLAQRAALYRVDVECAVRVRVGALLGGVGSALFVRLARHFRRAVGLRCKIVSDQKCMPISGPGLGVRLIMRCLTGSLVYAQNVTHTKTASQHHSHHELSLWPAVR